MKKRIRFDSNKCCGCKTCQLACSYKNEKVFNPEYSRIKIITRYKDLKFESKVCLQCKKAPCIDACQNNAIYKDDDGIVRINQELCTMCELCIFSCPFQSIIKANDSIVKCELCEGNPECVSSCPTNALLYY